MKRINQGTAGTAITGQDASGVAAGRNVGI